MGGGGFLSVPSGPGWRGAAHGGGDGRAAAAEHGLRVPVPPGGGQKVRGSEGGSPCGPGDPSHPRTLVEKGFCGDAGAAALVHVADPGQGLGI